MTVVRAAAGALAGGLLGAGLWGGAASLTGQEIGWAAWAVGALAGAGARLAGSREESHFDRRTRRMVRTRTGAAGPLAGGVAVAAAGVSILAGKLLLASLAPPAAKAEEREVADEETMVIYVADEIAHEYRLEGRDIAWPPEAVPFEAFAPDQFPPDIWSAAESRWSAMSLEEKRAFAERVGESIGDDIAFVEEGAGASLSGALGPLDLLWLGLAAVTAFAIAAFRRG